MYVCMKLCMHIYGAAREVSCKFGVGNLKRFEINGPIPTIIYLLIVARLLFLLLYIVINERKYLYFHISVFFR